MPGMDGKGPLGQGPGTGSGFGRCGRRFGTKHGFASGYAACRHDSVSVQHTAHETHEATRENKPVYDDTFAEGLEALWQKASSLEEKVSELSNLLQCQNTREVKKQKKSTKPQA